MKNLARIFAELTEALAAGASLLLLSDYDGTLAPLVARPADARLPREVWDDLRLLARAPVVRVGILSGRGLADLRALVGAPEVICAGCHGLEVDGPGVTFRHPGVERHRRTLAAIADALRLRLGPIRGARVEHKGLAVAVHYREVDPGALARLEIVLERLVHPRRNDLRLLRGKRVLELLPRVGWNKGECALWIRDHAFQAVPSGVTVLYMGDDRTDEIAFEVLAGKAVTVRVGPGRALTAARYRLADVTEVHRLLSALAGEVRKEEVTS